MIISKILTKTDVGIGNSHLAAILIPRDVVKFEIFPKLDQSLKNPKATISFEDDYLNIWRFDLAYYNSKFFGGKNNEFRLLKTIKYIRANSLKEGDKLEFALINDKRKISFTRQEKVKEEKNIILLKGSWYTVKTKF